jgi:hypothetical protein
MAQWIDNLVLLAGGSWRYVLPTGPNPVAGPLAPNVPLTLPATMLRIATTGLIYLSPFAANQPAANNLTGSGSVIVQQNVDPYFVVVPPNLGGMSFYSPNGATISIEAWF